MEGPTARSLAPRAAGRLVALLAAGLGLSTAPASAGSQVSMGVDEARVVRVATPPASVVVGNPQIADVTIQPNNIVVLHGRNYGTTNVIVLDRGGNEIATLDLAVSTGGKSRKVSLYRASERYSYVCSADCQVEINIGDPPEYEDKILKNFDNKNTLATNMGGKPKN